MKRNHKKAAFFDLDLTLTDKDSFRLFLKSYYFKNVKRMVYLPYVFVFGVLRKLRVISLARFKEAAMVGLKGKKHDEIREIGDAFFTKYLVKTLRPGAVERLIIHKYQGDMVFIVSASPDIYVHAVSSYLGCHGYTCTRLDMDKGRFSGRLFGPDCIGSEKKQQLNRISEKHTIDLSLSIAYSDHDTDLPFLEATGKCMVVNPNPKLLDIAIERYWDIANW